MTFIKRLAFMIAVFCFSSLLVNTQAQTPRMASVNITPESDKVRISAIGDVSEMRLEVVSEAGDIVFESGAITGQHLDWQMKDSQGERVAGGTYLVTVTYRTAAGKLRKRVEQVTVEEAEISNTQAAPAPQAVQETVTTSNPGVFGSIARFTGESTIANSVITQTIAGKIGIGSATPQARLEVAGNWTGEDGALRVSGDKPTIRFTGGPVVNDRSWIMHLGSNGPGNLEFYRRAGQTWGQVMSLTPVGNVGIGTANPTANLHVRSEVNFTPIKLTAGSGEGANTGTWRIQADNGLSGRGAAFVIYSDTAQQYRMVIDGQGRVGIGKTDPLVMLDVNAASGGAVSGSGPLYGVSGTGDTTGVDGFSYGGTGVNGGSVFGTGVVGQSFHGYGVHGINEGGYAGYFEGKVHAKYGYTQGSDRNLKANFAQVNPRLILDRLASIPIQTWNYKSGPESVRHIGPVAQDFRSAFNLGENDKTIATVDAAGVTMAAIQGLYQIVREKDEKIEALTRRMERQQAQLNQVKRSIRRKRTPRK
jgi:Chaperone of endosialidase